MIEPKVDTIHTLEPGTPAIPLLTMWEEKFILNCRKDLTFKLMLIKICEEKHTFLACFFPLFYVSTHLFNLPYLDKTHFFSVWTLKKWHFRQSYNYILYIWNVTFHRAEVLSKQYFNQKIRGKVYSEKQSWKRRQEIQNSDDAKWKKKKKKYPSCATCR